MSLEALRANSDNSTVFKTSHPSLTTSKYLLKWEDTVWEDTALFFIYKIIKFQYTIYFTKSNA